MRLTTAGLIIVAACSAPTSPAPVALQRDEAAVYSALVAHTLPARPVLIARTLDVDAHWWDEHRSALSDAVERETLDDFGAKLSAPMPVSTQLRALISPRAVIAAADSPHGRGPEVCAAYFQRFGEDATPFTLSRVGFNTVKTEALMLILRESCGGESMQTVLLHKHSGQWVPIVITDEAYD